MGSLARRIEQVGIPADAHVGNSLRMVVRWIAGSGGRRRAAIDTICVVCCFVVWGLQTLCAPRQQQLEADATTLTTYGR